MTKQRRIVRREPSSGPRFSWSALRPAELLGTFRAYFGLGNAARMGPIDTPEALAQFLDTRAAFIAQTSLYGYLRTRMGMRYPELFADDAFVEGVNIAKWQIWLDCLSDVSVYAGSRIAQQFPRETPRVAEMMGGLIDDILARTGQPHDAGKEFLSHSQSVRDRIARTDWLAVGDLDAAFTRSPASVVRWSPIVDELKALDEEIVLNSVTFRWQEVRRAFTRHLDAGAIIARLPEAPAN
jgi:hypothetical protein